MKAIPFVLAAFMAAAPITALASNTPPWAQETETPKSLSQVCNDLNKDLFAKLEQKGFRGFTASIEPDEYEEGQFRDMCKITHNGNFIIGTALQDWRTKDLAHLKRWLRQEIPSFVQETIDGVYQEQEYPDQVKEPSDSHMNLFEKAAGRKFKSFDDCKILGYPDGICKDALGVHSGRFSLFRF